MRIDFAGTGAAVSGNLNAPGAVLQSAVIYLLRVLVKERIAGAGEGEDRIAGCCQLPEEPLGDLEGKGRPRRRAVAKDTGASALGCQLEDHVLRPLVRRFPSVGLEGGGDVGRTQLAAVE